MWASWLILAGVGFLLVLWMYDWLTTEESIENATVRGRSHRAPMKDHYLFAEGGSSFLYDQISREHYWLTVELNGGKTELFEVPKNTYEKTLEGTQIKVRCAKGKVFGVRIKGLAR